MAKRSDKKTKFILMAIIIAVIIVSGVVIGGDPFYFLKENDDTVITNSPFSVHFIDVGQGDCTLIKTDKGNMLIDAGENGNESVVINYLNNQGIDSLTYLVATHPHSDHIGGVEEVIEAFDVQNVIMPRLSKNNTPTTQTYENMLKAIKNCGAKVIAAKPGNEYSFGDVSFKILSPYVQDENLNNMSVSLKLTYLNHSFMFTGDAEKEVEKQILKNNSDLSADVYKVAHHGSSTSNTSEFIDAVNPEFAIISCATDNSYGHPHDEIVELFNEKNIPYYTTAEWGTIVFEAKGKGLEMLAVKGDGIEVS